MRGSSSFLLRYFPTFSLASRPSNFPAPSTSPSLLQRRPLTNLIQVTHTSLITESLAPDPDSDPDAHGSTHLIESIQYPMDLRQPAQMRQHIMITSMDKAAERWKPWLRPGSKCGNSEERDP